MRITKESFDKSLGTYLATVFVKTLKPWRQFALGALIPTGMFSISRIPAGVLEAAGAVGPDGLVDTARLRDMAASGFDVSGPVHVDGIGITLDRGDAIAFLDWLDNNATAA